SYPNADARVVDEAISWLETQRADEPFFLFVSLHMPHEPYQPTDDAVSRVDPATLPPLNWQPGDLDTQPRYLRDDLGIPTSSRETDTFFPNGEADRAGIDAERCRYHALCGMLDEQVGRLLATLRQRGLDDNAAVVFTSDHGTALFDHGFRDKHSFHDPVWRVPMLIRPPGRFTPRRVAEPMSWVDLTATLLGWAGADTTQMQGFDLSETLNDADGRWPRNAVAASVFHTVALATQRWKIEFDLWRSSGRLFDRQADSLERNDLWSDDAWRAVRDRLLNALLGWHGSLHSPQLDHLHLGRGGPVADNARRAQSARPASAADVQLQHATAKLTGAYG
ncbi:MAG: sulfatase-like hydrolase/transferase, partial [Planctomycetota bacterium]